MFGRSVRGPLKLIKEIWTNEVLQSSSENFDDFKEKLQTVWELARTNLEQAQCEMKTSYDKNTRNRSFQPGEKVLVLLPVLDKPLSLRYSGPFTIHSKLSDLNYVINTPVLRRKKRVCHINS